jgi:hypothetical protein
MNKTIVSAFLLVAIATLSASAQDVPKINQAIPAAEEKTKVEVAQLSEAVKKTLATDACKNWQPTAAWSVNTTQPYYEVEVKMADKIKILKIDGEGKLK